jgi:hypothetical protein
LLVPGAASSIHVNGAFSMSRTQLHGYPLAVQHGILEAFVRSLHTMFLIGVPIAVVMLAGALMLKQVKLRTSSALERAAADANAGQGEGASEPAAVGAPEIG